MGFNEAAAAAAENPPRRARSPRRASRRFNEAAAAAAENPKAGKGYDLRDWLLQ